MSFKKHILNEEEMATIIDKNNYKITVYGEPMKNPSFHVTKINDFGVVLQIKDFSILEVKFGTYKKGIQLPNNILKDIRNILLEYNKKYDKSNWEALLFAWNLLHQTPIVDLKYKMPI